LPSSNMIGQSTAIEFVRDMIGTLANSASTVLITGESGTGKELAAQALHIQGQRKNSQFVPINCGAIPKDLIESELFGHIKGAYTGALADRRGRFEMADGGTLFLDEVGELPLDMQVKLLRCLQERSVVPLGSNRAIPFDVRIVAATNRDLDDEVAAGRFREDLYYRLNVLPLKLAPLRERRDDISPLLAHFSGKFAQEGMPPVGFAPDLLDALQHYDWPGNIRELSNLVDRFSTLFAGQQLSLRSIPAWLLPKGLVKDNSAATWTPSPVRPIEPEPDILSMVQGISGHGLAGGAYPEKGRVDRSVASEVTLSDLPAGRSVLPPDGFSLKDHLMDIERDYIQQALERSQGNVSKTARLLGLQRTTLIEKINKLGLKSPAEIYNLV
jgi:sigma-54 dependent transcriptional regulator, flagellar regulatory protein